MKERVIYSTQHFLVPVMGVWWAFGPKNERSGVEVLVMYCNRIVPSLQSNVVYFEDLFPCCQNQKLDACHQTLVEAALEEWRRVASWSRPWEYESGRKQLHILRMRALSFAQCRTVSLEYCARAKSLYNEFKLHAVTWRKYGRSTNRTQQVKPGVDSPVICALHYFVAIKNWDTLNRNLTAVMC